MLPESAIDLLRRVTASASGTVTRTASGWRIAGVAGLAGVVAGSDVGRLWRAGCLAGKRSSGTATVSAVGRRLAGCDGKAPALGSTIPYRAYKASREGTVVASTATMATVVPSARCRAQDGLPVRLDTVRRPHVCAPWKADYGGTAIGRWRVGAQYGGGDGALWARLAWFEPLRGEPHTLTRLTHVAERLTHVGIHHPRGAEERAAKLLCFEYNGQCDARMPAPRLDRLRYEACACRVSHCRGDVDDALADYFDAVIALHLVEIRAAELAATRDRVRQSIGSIWQNKRYPLKRDADGRGAGHGSVRA